MPLLARGLRRVGPVVALVALLAAIAQAQEWPQWRGPEGLGVSPDAVGLPEEWGQESANLRWRTEIPGAGSSSPIVSRGRVFVTAALEGQGGPASLALSAALVAVALWVIWAAWRGRSRVARLLTAVSILFAGLSVLTVLQPGLFLEAGNPGRTWRALATLALLGLGAALFWLRAASPGRLAGAIVVLLLSAYLGQGIPSGPRGGPALEKIVAVVLPGIVAGLWGVRSFLRARRGAPSQSPGDPGMALALAALATLLFVPPNFLTGLQRTVVCVDLATGDVVWQRAVFRAAPEQKSPWGSYATPTATADGERVFAYFGMGLAALDFEGRVLWTRDFPDYGGHSRYGAATSPVLVGDTVVLLKESELYQEGPPTWMAAFDKQTGEVRWRVEPADAHDSYGTPLLLDDGSSRRLVTGSWELLLGFDADSGERLWSHPYRMQQLVSSLAREGDLVAVTGGNHGEKSLMVFRLPAVDSADGPELVWESTRGVATVVSPVLYRGLLYTVNRSGIMTVYAAETGEVLWKKRLAGEYFASLVAGDGKVYVTNTEGTTTVLAAGGEHREIAVNDLPDGAYASPAIADGGLVIRSGGELFFIEGDPGYPAHWWEPVPESERAWWEILPQAAGPGEVILSKRHELGLLSNFAATPFELRGRRYASLEGLWQSMKYPEGPDDPRATAPGATWEHSREEVENMVAFEANAAGQKAEENMAALGIDWVTYEGERIEYKGDGRARHYEIIEAATRAKVAQNSEVRAALMATGDLILRPDHATDETDPPAWRYFEIYMKIRAELRAAE